MSFSDKEGLIVVSCQPKGGTTSAAGENLWTPGMASDGATSLWIPDVTLQGRKRRAWKNIICAVKVKNESTDETYVEYFVSNPADRNVSWVECKLKETS